MEKNFGPAEESDCFEGAQFGRQWPNVNFLETKW
jgi:hypothetical protein